MNRKRESKWWFLGAAFAAMGALVFPPFALSQGCSLCYSQAASSGARLIQALRSGILILVFPPLVICVMAMVLAYRRRNQFREPCRGADPDSDW